MSNDLDIIEVNDLREQYFKVSNRIADEDLDLDIFEIGIYAILCRFTNNITKKSYPSITKIQKITKLSRPKVINTIKSLVNKKIVFKKQGHIGKQNVYYLVSLPSKRDLLVNEIYQPSKRDLPVVVNQVYSKKTNIKKLNEKDSDFFSFSLNYISETIYNILEKDGRKPNDSFLKCKKIIESYLKDNDPAVILGAFNYALESDFWKNKVTFKNIETVISQFKTKQNFLDSVKYWKLRLDDKFKI